MHWDALAEVELHGTWGEPLTKLKFEIGEIFGMHEVTSTPPIYLPTALTQNMNAVLQLSQTHTG
jgi:hypothetical protein